MTGGAVFFGLETGALALELDWNGQFRAEYHYLYDYTLDHGAGGQLDPTRMQNITLPNGQNTQIPSGYYIPGGGNTDATFETLFLRLQPKAIVNDNVTIKSELWLGNPTYGIFGDSFPYTFDQRQFYSSQSRGAFITAQRVWAEILTDFGTVEVGRAPLNYGLGLFWNAGDGMWDRYESTADQVRLVTRFGPFTISPGMAVYSTGNNLGGSCTFNFNSAVGTPLCSPNGAWGSIADYNVMLKYENLDEDFEASINFVRRMGNGLDPLVGAEGTTSPTPVAGMGYNVWDIYAKKRIGKVKLAAEVPITSGELGGMSYSSFAAALEGNWKISDTWESNVKLGRAPGNPNADGNVPQVWRAFFFNPNYHIANVMFNYQLANLGGVQGVNTLNNPMARSYNLISAFDNPIVNANYINWSGTLHLEKWDIDTGLTYAFADQAAQAGTWFYNTWNRRYEQANYNQDKSLGFEWDLGTGFHWDDSFLFRVDLGMFLPGAFYKFSNTATQNATNILFNAVGRVGISF